MRARTFRATFQNSDAASATFTRTGVPVLGRDLSPLPEVSFSRMGKALLIQNRNGQIFSAEVFSAAGERVASIAMTADIRQRTVSGVEPGMYVVKMNRGSWSTTRKLALP